MILSAPPVRSRIGNFTCVARSSSIASWSNSRCTASFGLGCCQSVKERRCVPERVGATCFVDLDSIDLRFDRGPFQREAIARRHELSCAHPALDLFNLVASL